MSKKKKKKKIRIFATKLVCLYVAVWSVFRFLSARIFAEWTRANFRPFKQLAKNAQTRTETLAM